MHNYERDYRYLLQNLLPRHRLSGERRRGIARALSSGADGDVRRESVRALEELCRSEFFVRTELRRENGNVIAGYRRVGGQYRVSVSLPRDEWESLSGSLPAAAPPREEATVDPLPSVAERSPTGAVAFLPDIMKSLDMGERPAPLMTRLESILESLSGWFGLAGIDLFILDEAVGHFEPASDRVRVCSDDDLRGFDRVWRVIETGSQRVVARADAPIAGPAGVEWTEVGVAPVFGLGRPQGLLYIYFDGRPDEKTPATRLKLCATVVRQVLEFHQRIETMTSVDSLTGLYNRGFFDAQLPVEVERATRTGVPMSMLVLDIDDFKRINDELGHRKGDEALVAIAGILRRNLRKVDIAFRYGGEEIVIILPGTPELESVYTAERLRRVIAAHEGFRDAHGRARSLTVSVGVSIFPDTASSAEDLFAQADTAMYRAKGMGKNRVVCYREVSPTGE